MDGRTTQHSASQKGATIASTHPPAPTNGAARTQEGSATPGDATHPLSRRLSRPNPKIDLDVPPTDGPDYTRWSDDETDGADSDQRDPTQLRDPLRADQDATLSTTLLMGAHGLIMGGCLMILGRPLLFDIEESRVIQLSALGVLCLSIALSFLTIWVRHRKVYAGLQDALMERAFSEERLRDYAEASSDWFWETDTDLVFTYVSERAKKVLGQNAIGLLGGSLDALWKRRVNKPSVLEPLPSDKPFQHVDVKVTDAKGKLRHIRLSGTPKYDADGRIIGFRGTGDDVTAEISARLEAEDLRDQLTDAVESISEGFVLFDQDGKLVVVNDRYQSAYPTLAPFMKQGNTFENLLRQAAQMQGLGAGGEGVEGWVKRRLMRHMEETGPTDVLLSDGNWYRISERPTRGGGVVKLLTDISELKRQEVTLADHAALLDGTFSSVTQGIAVFDADARLRILNDRLIELVALPRHMTQEGTDYDSWVDLDQDRGSRIITRPGYILMDLADRPLLLQDCRTTMPNDRILDWVHTKLPNGGFVVTVTDVTQSERLNHVLQGLAGTAGPSGQEVCYQLCEGLSVALGMELGFIGAIDPNSGMIKTSATYVDGAPGSPYVYDPKDTPTAQVFAEETLMISRGVCNSYPKDQGLLDLAAESYVGQVLRLSDGTPIGIIAGIGRTTLRSLTEARDLLPVFAARASAELERQLAADSLAERESLLRTFVQFTPAAVAMVDQDLRYLRVSDRWMTEFELFDHSLIGAHHYDVFPETPETWRQEHARVLGEGAVIEDNECTLERNGRVHWLRRQDHPWYRSDGSIGGMMMFVDVITARKEAELALQQSQKMDAIGRLAGGIAHEFNNMLTSIAGFARMAQRTPDRVERVKTCLDEIIISADRASDLTGQMLSFSRRDAVARISDTDLDALVADSVKFLRPVLGETIHVLQELETDLPKIRADANQVRQAIINLCINARDAMPDGGTITLMTDLVVPTTTLRRRLPPLIHAVYASLEVRDTGSGIPEDILHRVFEPFFTTKEQGKGTGLGLAQVYSACEYAGGAVDVDSQSGVGTGFTLYFRLCSEAEEAFTTPPNLPVGSNAIVLPGTDPTSGDEPSPGPGGIGDGSSMGGQDSDTATTTTPLRVLLVEDEDSVRRYGRMILEDRGHTVVEASDGRMAMERFDTLEGEIDVVVTDVIMPRMGGLELTDRLSRLKPSLKLVLMSGYASGMESLGVVGQESRRMVSKPVKPEDLITAVEE